MSGGEVSSVDLARVALRAAMEQARKNGGGQKSKQKQPRMVRTVRRDGREPMGRGAAIGALVTELPGSSPLPAPRCASGGRPSPPELAGHVVAVGYDADSGQLTVCRESPAWATKTRLEQTRIVDAANKSAGQTVVRALQILAPGSVPASDPDAPHQPGRACGPGEDQRSRVRRLPPRPRRAP